MPRVAAIWTVVAATGNDVTVNVALVAPAGTVTLGGTLAEPGSWLDRLTTTPPVGAALVSVTVPVEGFPPVTLVGLRVNVESETAGGGGGGAPRGSTVKVADLVTPPPETEIVTRVCWVTRVVKMSKPPAITPAGIMTLLLIRATAGFELVIGKTTSVVAGDAMVTVANDPPVPVTEVGFKVRVAGGGTGVKVICDCALAPFQVPVIVAVVLVVTALVGMEAEAEKSPGNTVTDLRFKAGTWNAG